MLKKWHFSIRLRIVFSLLLVLILVMGGLGLYFSPSPINQLEADNSRTYSCNNSAMTQAQIATYLNIKLDTLEELVNKLKLTPAAICSLPEPS